MTDVGVLLRGYYEALYERLAPRQGALRERIGQVLREVLAERGWGQFGSDRFAGYLEAAEAFLHERLEMYNPIGFHWTLDSVHSPLAAKLELQLDWYDATAEFERLRAAARELVEAAEAGMDDARLKEAAGKMIRRCGAFPDRSIIEAYGREPAAHKVPDYAVAVAIEEALEAKPGEGEMSA